MLRNDSCPCHSVHPRQDQRQAHEGRQEGELIGKPRDSLNSQVCDLTVSAGFDVPSERPEECGNTRPKTGTVPRRLPQKGISKAKKEHAATSCGETLPKDPNRSTGQNLGLFPADYYETMEALRARKPTIPFK